MKSIILGDTHLGYQKSSATWHTITINLFESIIDTCVRENIHTIFHLGDFFNDRNQINILTISVARRIAQMLQDSNILTYIVKGNHDLFYKNVIFPSSLDIFELRPLIKIIDEPTIIEDITLVPWLWDKLPEQKTKYLMGHLEVTGFPMNGGYNCEKGVNKEIFKDYEMVLSGHFHGPSEIGNIKYIGNPFQMNFGDRDSNRGYYIFDEGKLEFIEYKEAPKFIVYHTEKSNMSKDYKGNIVKIIFDKDYGLEGNGKIIEDVRMMNPLILRTDFSNINDGETEEELEQNCDMLEHTDIIKQYIDKSKAPEGLSKKIITEMALQIKKECE